MCLEGPLRILVQVNFCDQNGCEEYEIVMRKTKAIGIREAEVRNMRRCWFSSMTNVWNCKNSLAHFFYIIQWMVTYVSLGQTVRVKQ